MGEENKLIRAIYEQKKHWKRLLKGKMPEKAIIEGWIETADFMAEDAEKLKAKLTKYETAMERCISAMEGSNCEEWKWLKEALKRR